KIKRRELRQGGKPELLPGQKSTVPPSLDGWLRVSALAELLSMKTGRPSTGLHHATSRQRVYQYRHALKGLCVLCPQTVEGTSCYCAKHKRQVNEAQRKRYHAKKAKSEVRS